MNWFRDHSKEPVASEEEDLKMSRKSTSKPLIFTTPPELAYPAAAFPGFYVNYNDMVGVGVSASYQSLWHDPGIKLSPYTSFVVFRFRRTCS